MSSPSGSGLRVEFCDYPAAKHACLNWHYSKSMPVGSIVKVGAWEDGQFIGVVLFAHGATQQIGSPYGLTQFECIELVRVALTAHEAPVTQIVAAAIRLLKRQSPDLKLIVSYADPEQGHHGGIYQAGNWIYQGRADANSAIRINGRVRHRRTLNSVYGTSDVARLNAMGIKAEMVHQPGKHKYLYPLTKKIAKAVQLLACPYPKSVIKL